MEDLSHIILGEIRDLRTEVNQRNERLASIETSLHELLGNGNPGRLRLMEIEIKRNTAFRLNSKGALAVLGAVNLGTIMAIIEYVVKGKR